MCLMIFKVMCLMIFIDCNRPLFWFDYDFSIKIKITYLILQLSLRKEYKNFFLSSDFKEVISGELHPFRNGKTSGLHQRSRKKGLF